jgi:hypothetical protein
MCSLSEVIEQTIAIVVAVFALIVAEQKVVHPAAGSIGSLEF